MILFTMITYRKLWKLQIPSWVMWLIMIHQQNDGSFECSIEIISRNVGLLDQSSWW